MHFFWIDRIDPENVRPAPPPDRVPPPKEIMCTLCDEVLRDAVIVPCCTGAFCDECEWQEILHITTIFVIINIPYIHTPILEVIIILSNVLLTLVLVQVSVTIWWSRRRRGAQCVQKLALVLIHLYPLDISASRHSSLSRAGMYNNYVLCKALYRNYYFTLEKKKLSISSCIL